jgi:tetratricopeptide (TPR) repeat protein
MRNGSLSAVYYFGKMRSGLWLTVAVLSVLGGSGCQHVPSAEKMAGEHYYEAGFRAEEQGNLTVARTCFYQAYEFAQARALGPGPEAFALYEWSRMTGYLGMVAEAEGGFTNVLTLIDVSQGRAEKLRPLVLCELARLLHDTKQHSRAIPVFESAIHELQRANAPQKVPLGFAEFLDDYADSLNAIGELEVAKGVAVRSTAIKLEHETGLLRFHPRRYGGTAVK